MSSRRPLINGRLAASLAGRARRLSLWARGPGRHMATSLTSRGLHHIRRNLTPRRLLSFPHLVFFFWMLIILWGERWVFDSKVDKCAWKNWESWPKGARPHHLVLVADPQITDPHSYPSQPWPISSLTVRVTDNYLRRGYIALQKKLHPDSLFFLGDLFDGGREWKTRLGTFVDPKWGIERSDQEKGLVDKWHRKYGEDFWVKEYQRFGKIFFDNWPLGGNTPGPWQRGRKLVASLPGNHDLGFGSQIQVPVRDRFSAFFGDMNRVDVVGNHTIVSVDTVSLSADTSLFKEGHDLQPIFGPPNEFLSEVQSLKRKAAERELKVWYGEKPGRDFKHKHKVEDLATAEISRVLHDPGQGAADFPTILLTHVPLYRGVGTPCGPGREHWPPAKPPKGQTTPVNPDEPNAIEVVAGYQYQNVLSEEDSVKLVKSVGNVIQVFSGDDHDYCEIVHTNAKNNVREITVKSMSMAMGVSMPGFIMVSLYNPVGADGKPIPGSPEKTMQTHMCILPSQMHTYVVYIFLAILTVAVLAVRAFLVPVLNLTPFALEATPSGAAILPVFKDKEDPPEYASWGSSSSATAAKSSSSASASNGSARWSAKKSRQPQRWGWNNGARPSGPRINLEESFYDGGKVWKTSRTRAGGLNDAGRELWTTTWRVVWMSGLFWLHLLRKG